MSIFWASLALLCALLNFFLFFFSCPIGLFLGSRAGSKTVLEPTNADYQFLFWKYSTIFLFFIGPNFGPFCTFWGYFWGWGQVQKLFWNLCRQSKNFYFESIALSCFSETFPGGWRGGWLSGKSDFNKRSVVELDLDLGIIFQPNEGKV